MSGNRTSYVTPAIRVVDAPISKKSPEQWRAIVEYKALAFVHDNNYASIAYDLKAARAIFDPNLADGNGGYRCPPGVRYGGQITDRYGRGCGFGVARRIVNAIGDAARRAESALDKRRERRVERRNARVGRQIGLRGSVKPGRAGRGMATRLEDFADRRDRRQGRGGAGAPGMATRLEDFADRRDRRQGRGIATRLEDFADRRDEDQGIKPPRRRGVAPAGQNRRPRRTDAVGETAANRPRPKRPSTPVAEVKPPQRRQRGPRVNVDDLNSAERARLDDALDRERDALNARWKRRLGGEDPTPEKIRAYVEAREQRSKPGYVNTLKAMERDHAVLNGNDRIDRVNDLAPSVRKRIIGGSIEDQGNARPQPPRAPRRPVKKRAVKKAPAKRPAKKAPAKKAPAKKAPAKKAAANPPENSVPSFIDLDPEDRNFVFEALDAQDLAQTPQQIEAEIERALELVDADGLDDMARILENGAKDDRRKARTAARPPRERVAYQAIAERKETKALKLRQRAEVERARAGNERDDSNRLPKPGTSNPSAPLSLEAFSVTEQEFIEDELKRRQYDPNEADNIRMIAGALADSRLQGLVDVNESNARENRARARDAQLAPEQRYVARLLADRDNKRADIYREEIAKRAGASGSPKPPDTPGAAGNPPKTPSTDTEKPEVAGKPRRNVLGLARRKDKRDRAKLGKFDKNGFADPKRVEVGNKGIINQAKATNHLKDGGDMADVPDDFLAVAMERNLGPGKRFTITRKPTTSNSPTLVRDTKTGQGLLIKRYTVDSVGFNEDVNDLIGNHLAERFGFPNGQMRFAGKLNGPKGSPRSSVPVVFELGDNFVDGQLEDPNPLRYDIKNLIRATLFDYAIINSDRHNGNYFNAVKDGKHYFFPIDQSLGFNARKNGPNFSGEANAAGLANWYRKGYGGGRNIMGDILRDARDPASRRQIISEIKKLQTDLAKAERQESSSGAISRMLGQFPGRKYATDEGRSHKDAAKRIQWLINTRAEEIADVLQRGR